MTDKTCYFSDYIKNREHLLVKVGVLFILMHPKVFKKPLLMVSRDNLCGSFKTTINQLAKLSIMVTIVNCKQVETAEGKVFTSLEIQGDVRFVKSKATENFYLAADRTRISSALSLDFCRTLIGQKLPGTVEKVECEPYEYVNKEGDTITLHHTFVYSPDESANVQQQQINPFLGFGQQQQSFYPQAQQIPMNFMQQVGMVAEA